MTRCVGHRGAAGLAPENTVAAFEAGIAAGADLLECDVHVTADGHLVLMHDADVSRTTDGRGRIGAMTLQEIKQLNAAAAFGHPARRESVPTLDDFLTLARGRCAVQVEIKVPDGVAYPGIEQAIVSDLRRFGALKSAQVICFDAETLIRVQSLAPELTLGFLASRSSLPAPLRRSPTALAAYAKQAGAGFLSLERRLVSADHQAAARAMGLGLAAWTVNEQSEMATFARMGLDAITSDRPDILRSVLDGLVAADREVTPAGR